MGTKGESLIELVEMWHSKESSVSGGSMELIASFYLVLSWNKKGSYQLHQFPLILPDPSTLYWYFPNKTRKGVEEPAQRLCGADETGVIFEWYGQSGAISSPPQQGRAGIRKHDIPPDIE